MIAGDYLMCQVDCNTIAVVFVLEFVSVDVSRAGEDKGCILTGSWVKVDLKIGGKEGFGKSILISWLSRIIMSAIRISLVIHVYS